MWLPLCFLCGFIPFAIVSDNFWVFEQNFAISLWRIIAENLAFCFSGKIIQFYAHETIGIEQWNNICVLLVGYAWAVSHSSWKRNPPTKRKNTFGQNYRQLVVTACPVDLHTLCGGPVVMSESLQLRCACWGVIYSPVIAVWRQLYCEKLDIRSCTGASPEDCVLQ